jgi:hypothetical protein
VIVRRRHKGIYVDSRTPFARLTRSSSFAVYGGEWVPAMYLVRGAANLAQRSRIGRIPKDAEPLLVIWTVVLAKSSSVDSSTLRRAIRTAMTATADLGTLLGLSTGLSVIPWSDAAAALTLRASQIAKSMAFPPGVGFPLTVPKDLSKFPLV